MKYLRYIVPALIPCLALAGAWLFAYGWQTATVGESPMSPRDGANAFTTIIAGAMCFGAAFACVFFTTLLWEKKP